MEGRAREGEAVVRQWLVVAATLLSCGSSPPRYADDGTASVVRRVRFISPLPCAPDESAVEVETCTFKGCVSNVYLLRGVKVQ